MRAYVDLRSHQSSPQEPIIVQVGRTPEVGVPVGINGQYIIPLPEGVEIPIDASSYVLDGAGNIDGGDISSLGFADLLARYPSFSNIYFNPLINADHVAELVVDGSEVFTDPDTGTTYQARIQTGRVPGTDEGQMPTHTAILPATNGGKPGILLSKEIDLTPYLVDPAGFDQFMLYWYFVDFDVTHDIAAEAGLYDGVNSPAIRSVLETDQEPADLQVYISPDGTNWCEVGLLESVALCDPATSIRVAFRNNGTTNKMYLAHFAVLF